jgi:lipopolysaccharide/colanic/teichoic acid biosynthesis glycosyltransferase
MKLFSWNTSGGALVSASGTNSLRVAGLAWLIRAANHIHETSATWGTLIRGGTAATASHHGPRWRKDMNSTASTEESGRFRTAYQVGTAIDWPARTQVPIASAAPVESSASRLKPVRGVGPFERLVAAAASVALSPLMLLIAVAIKLERPRGPVFYRQERVGLDRRQAYAGSAASAANRRETHGYGMLFRIWKFRTMVPDAERLTGPVWATENDPRATSVGRILRRLRLDELPQLFNVVAGEMRLIGPRPERPHFVEQLCRDIPEYAQRMRVPPGITGLAQVEREYDSSVEDVRTKVKYDLFYARHRSSLMDLKILLKTVDVVLTGKGAH